MNLHTKLLLDASKNDDEDIILELLKNDDVDINAIDEFMMIPLHYAA